MNYESHDGEVVTGMLGCGCQLVAFTTGRGNPTGHPVAPIIKVTGNPSTYKNMSEMFDFDASPIITEGKTIDEMGQELLDLVIRVAEGELTSAERFGGRELFCVGRRHGYQKKSREQLWEGHSCCE